MRAVRDTSNTSFLRGAPGVSGSTQVVASPRKSIITSLTATGSCGAYTTRPEILSSVE